MYTILEIQKTAETTAVLTYTANSAQQAQQIYHEKLAYAAMSTIPVHKVIMLGDMLEICREEMYTHDTN